MSTDDHPWHQVSPGDHIPDLVNAIIEIPKGSKAKYEIDKASGLIKLDRVLFSSLPLTFTGRGCTEISFDYF